MSDVRSSDFSSSITVGQGSAPVRSARAVEAEVCWICLSNPAGTLPVQREKTQQSAQRREGPAGFHGRAVCCLGDKKNLQYINKRSSDGGSPPIGVIGRGRERRAVRSTMLKIANTANFSQVAVILLAQLLRNGQREGSPVISNRPVRVCR